VNIETKKTAQNIAIIYLSGDLNTDSLNPFKSEIKDLVEQGIEKIIVDCRELGIISSSGLAALLWARSAGGAIYMTHVSALVSNVLEITRLSRILKIEPTTRGLLEKFGAIRKTQKRRKKVAY